MKKKILVILFFIIVFGFPITWYLILQIYGENKFDLPKLGTIQNGCISESARATLIIDSVAVQGAINEWNRLQSFISDVDTSDIRIVLGKSCQIEFAAVFIEAEGEVRGEYGFSREEVDRMITEMDIYLMNIKIDDQSLK